MIQILSFVQLWSAHLVFPNHHLNLVDQGFSLHIYTNNKKKERQKEEKPTINACENMSLIKYSVSKFHVIKIFFLQILQVTFQIRYIQNLSINVYK